MKKILHLAGIPIGILACLVAAYNLCNMLLLTILARHSTAPVYGALLLISLAGIVLFVRAWMGKMSMIEKKIGVTAFFGGSIAAIFLLPITDPVIWTIISFFAASTCLILDDTHYTFREIFGAWRWPILFGHVILFLTICLALRPRQCGHDLYLKLSPMI